MEECGSMAGGLRAICGRKSRRVPAWHAGTRAHTRVGSVWCGEEAVWRGGAKWLALGVMWENWDGAGIWVPIFQAHSASRRLLLQHNM